MENHLKSQISSLPLSPGIYIFKGKQEEVLYVGKAGKLRSRVRSYFSKISELSAAKQMMVKKIADIETIITSSESEALILESVLIKKHQPPYNITLKDDKNYQFVKIDYRYARPTVTTARRPEHDSGRARARYFGPYTSGFELQESLRLLRRIFPWRKPAKGWSASGRKDGMSTFELDLLKKRTIGPLPETDEEYRLMINRLIRVLEGHSEEVMADLKNWMTELSANKHFEQASRVRDQIRALQIFNSRQKMVSVRGESQDVISLYRQNDSAAVNVFVIRAGKLIDKRNFLLQHTAGESDQTLLDAFLTQYYNEATDLPKELIIPIQTTLTKDGLNNLSLKPSPYPSLEGRGQKSPPLLPPSTSSGQALGQGGASESPPLRGGARGGAGVTMQHITLPAHGKKRELIKLGETNAHDYLLRSLASWQQPKNEAALKELQEALRLKKIPERIEGYDISNIQGQYAVGAMVFFTNGEPDKKEYRKFKIKTVRGANDFAMLAEVLKRRFKKTFDKKHVTSDRWKLPDLILLDGGKGQLSTVLRALLNVKSQLSNVVFIALAKRAEEIFQGPNLRPVNLSPAAPGSRLLQRIRDEAHRFAQSYYHTRHIKAGTKSALNEIPGLGPKTRQLLIKKFGSLASVRKASKDDIIKVIGKNKTDRLSESIQV